MTKPIYNLTFGLLPAITVSSLQANNIMVSNTKLTGQNTTDSYVMVGFNLIQENCNQNPGNFNNRDASLLIIKNYAKPGVYRQDDKFSSCGLAATFGLIKQVGLTNRILALNNSTIPAAKTSLFKGIDLAT
jgi:hypothetical protein